MIGSNQQKKGSGFAVINRKLKLFIMFIVTLLFLSACSFQQADDGNEELIPSVEIDEYWPTNSEHIDNPDPLDDALTGKPHHEPEVKDRPVEQSKPEGPQSEELEISSIEEEQNTEESKTESIVEEIPNHTQPVLMKISLTDKKDDVLDLYGEPLETVILDSNFDPIQVFKYEHHSVGFDNTGQVVFVEVTSTDAITGLNGIKIGSTISQVLQAFGEPNHLTDYVISYEFENAIIKMDLNPSLKTIVSIKMFALSR